MNADNPSYVDWQNNSYYLTQSIVGLENFRLNNSRLIIYKLLTHCVILPESCQGVGGGRRGVNNLFFQLKQALIVKIKPTALVNPDTGFSTHQAVFSIPKFSLINQFLERLGLRLCHV